MLGFAEHVLGAATFWRANLDFAGFELRKQADLLATTEINY